MPDVFEEFMAETMKDIFQEMTPEQRRKWFPPEEILKGLSVEDLLAALSAEQREAFAKRIRDDGV